MSTVGRPKLSSTQMQARGTRPDRVRQRVSEETVRDNVLQLHAPTEVPTPPADLVDAEACDLFSTIHSECLVTNILARVVSQCCYALQRCNQMRQAIDRYPNVADVPRHLLSGERDARQQYTTLLDKLGVFRGEQ